MLTELIKRAFLISERAELSKNFIYLAGKESAVANLYVRGRALASYEEDKAVRIPNLGFTPIQMRTLNAQEQAIARRKSEVNRKFIKIDEEYKRRINLLKFCVAASSVSGAAVGTLLYFVK